MKRRNSTFIKDKLKLDASFKMQLKKKTADEETNKEPERE